MKPTPQAVFEEPPRWATAEEIQRSSGPPRTSGEVARLSRCGLRTEGNHDSRAMRSCPRSRRSTSSPFGAHSALRYDGAAPRVGPGLHARGRALECVAAHRSRARRAHEAPSFASSRGRKARARGACSAILAIADVELPDGVNSQTCASSYGPKPRGDSRSITSPGKMACSLRRLAGRLAFVKAA